jgi:hypothetical protein
MSRDVLHVMVCDETLDGLGSPCAFFTTSPFHHRPSSSSVSSTRCRLHGHHLTTMLSTSQVAQAAPTTTFTRGHRRLPTSTPLSSRPNLRHQNLLVAHFRLAISSRRRLIQTLLTASPSVPAQRREEALTSTALRRKSLKH